LITLDLQAKKSNDAIEELAGLLEREGKLFSKAGYIRDVQSREQKTSTEVGHGIAIPHARSGAVRETSIAFGRSEGFYWNSSVQEQTELVFLLAVSDKNPNKRYMQILAGLARKLIHDDFRARLKIAKTPSEVLEVIQEGRAKIIDN
jgi:PTS system fructose-specific IIA component/PTS system nitrogen regulatory IIA component